MAMVYYEGDGRTRWHSWQRDYLFASIIVCSQQAAQGVTKPAPPEEIHPYYQGGEGKSHRSTHQVTPQIWRPSSPSTVLRAFVSWKEDNGILSCVCLRFPNNLKMLPHVWPRVFYRYYIVTILQPMIILFIHVSGIKESNSMGYFILTKEIWERVIREP